MTAARTNGGNAINRMAAVWVTRKLRGLNSAEQAELDAWLRSDPRHSGSFLRAQAIDRLACIARDIEQPQSEASAAPARLIRQAAPRRRIASMAIAASLVAVVCLGAFWRLLPDSIATERGEIRNIAMSDGSTAVLGTDSTIQIAMRAKRRMIELKDGQAWFDVAHDRARPFEVRHGDIVVRATGTAFEVGARPQGVEVVVTEGSVIVLKDGAAAPIARLRARERLVYGAGAARRDALDAAALHHRMAWREGMIVLDGKRLGDAVEEVNRYNALPIRIANPALADQRVFGTFRARNPEGLTRALAIALDAKVVVNDEAITLR